MYKRGSFTGPDDVALIRTKKNVVFEPGRIVPVGADC